MTRACRLLRRRLVDPITFTNGGGEEARWLDGGAVMERMGEEEARSLARVTALGHKWLGETRYFKRAGRDRRDACSRAEAETEKVRVNAGQVTP